MKVTIIKSIRGNVWMIRFLDYSGNSYDGWSQPYSTKEFAVLFCKANGYTIVS